MATNIGTGPQDIPLNQFLGEMAFADKIPKRPAFSVHNSGSDFTLVNDTKITCFTTTDYNYFGGYNTSNQRFTAPESGLYLFGGHIRIGAPGKIRVARITLYVDGSYYTDLASVGGTADYDGAGGYDHPPASGTQLIYLNAGQYVELYVGELSVSTTTYIQNGRRAGWFGILMF